MLKLSKTAIRELTSRYRDVLRKCMLSSVVALGLSAAASANAADTWQGVIDETNDFMDSLVTEHGWDRNNDPVTGYGVSSILGYMGEVATATDEAIADVATLKTTVADNTAAITAETERAQGVEGTLTNLTTEAKTNLVAAINEVDAHADANAAAITAEVERAEAAEEALSVRITANTEAIGDRNYTSSNYVAPGSDLTSAISALDAGVGELANRTTALEDRTSKLERKTEKYHHEMKSGFASLAALSALVPNARATGDTQLSVGTGYYRGTTGFALGAFQHVNDDVLLHVGAAYAGNGSATFRGGATIGF